MYDRNAAAEVPVSPPAPTFRTRLGGLVRGQGRNLGLILALAIALLILAIFSPKYFLNRDGGLNVANFIVVALQVSFDGIGAIGMGYLIISGNVDLSVGSMFAICAVTSAILAKVMPPLPAIVIGIAVGGVIGLLNGLLVWRVKLSPIIITLGSMTILRGVVLLMTGGFGVRGVPKEFSGFGQARPFDVPMPVWAFFILAIIGHIILAHTTLGRHIFAIGGSRDASEAAGINVRKLVLGAFTVNGLIVGLAAVLAASRFGSATPAFGVGYELNVITAVILGGVAFTGGEGNILGVVLAVFLLGIIDSGLVSLGVDPHYSDIVKGAALVIAVTLDQISQERQARYRTLLAMRERK